MVCGSWALHRVRGIKCSLAISANDVQRVCSEKEKGACEEKEEERGKPSGAHAGGERLFLSSSRSSSKSSSSSLKSFSKQTVLNQYSFP